MDTVYVLEMEDEEQYYLLGFYSTLDKAFDAAEEQSQGDDPVALDALTVIEMPLDAYGRWTPRADGHVVVVEGKATLCNSWMVSDGRPEVEADDTEDRTDADDVEEELDMMDELFGKAGDDGW